MLKRIVATTILTLTITTTSPALASESRSKTFRCPEAMKIAKQAGWRNHQLQQLDFIIYRETGTTCLCPYIRSTDFGYTQINDRTWVSYLKQLKIIDHEKQLLHPRTNLVAAKALYDYAVDRGIDGWTAWHTNKPNGSGNVSK
jgi:hypothetical protein